MARADIFAGRGDVFADCQMASLYTQYRRQRAPLSAVVPFASGIVYMAASGSQGRGFERLSRSVASVGNGRAEAEVGRLCTTLMLSPLEALLGHLGGSLMVIKHAWQELSHRYTTSATETVDAADTHACWGCYFRARS